MSNVIPLSLAAHEKALRTPGSVAPLERRDLMCWPMKWTHLGPVFDEARMRQDQVPELAARLEKLAGPATWGTTEQAVAQFMVAYGRFGQRVRDVCEHVNATKPVVLKYLRELVADGRVFIVEQQTRGETGSKRKVYYSAESERNLEQNRAAHELLARHAEHWESGGSGGSGILYHGTAVDGVSCRCGACRAAIFDGLCDEQRSRARAAGETGLAVDLERAQLRKELEIMRLEVDGGEIRAIL